MIDVACAIIIDDEGRTLAAQRSESMSLPLKWEFPGGKLSVNETAEDCIIREIEEELNIIISIIDKLPDSIYQYPQLKIKLIPFICRQVSGELIMKEHANLKWFSKSELLNLDWAEADIAIVQNFLTNH